LVWEQWREVFGLPCETVYGISPIQHALPICRDMQLLQDAADQVEEPEVQNEPLQAGIWFDEASVMAQGPKVQEEPMQPTLPEVS